MHLKITLNDTHAHSVGLLRASDRPVAETSLPDTPQHSQETDIHAPGGIRTRNPSTRAAADPCLRTRGHWDVIQHTKSQYPLHGIHIFNTFGLNRGTVQMEEPNKQRTALRFELYLQIII